MAYDELTQAQLDRLTEGYRRRSAELEAQVADVRAQAREVELELFAAGGFADGLKKRIAELEGTISALDENLETAAARIESLEERLFEAQRLTGEVVEQRDTARRGVERLCAHGAPPDPESLDWVKRARARALLEEPPLGADPAPTPPSPTFSVRRSYTENQDPRPPFIEIGLRRG